MIGIDMEKPKCCLDCPCYNAEFVCCDITDTRSWDLDCFEEVFEDCPLVDDVAPVKHAHWIPKQHPFGNCECSNCHEEYCVCGGLLGDYNFCPNCGADMREEEQQGS